MAVIGSGRTPHEVLLIPASIVIDSALSMTISRLTGGRIGKIKAIVVRTGFGCRVHVPALRAAGFEVAALVGRNEERLQRKAAENAVPTCFTDLDEAISATGAALVTIATTPNTHATLAHEAITLGCNVLCEKPLAFNADEGGHCSRPPSRRGSSTWSPTNSAGCRSARRSDRRSKRV
ncbi:Gfo/Idh/MocA family oxidoreductase (plasmid) [Novosphingobium sp. BL-8A]|uniref:Gfo/Idh/MocA family protein n=1 Tax=Novosphingobium sp. BL-8A TaxID=3127639 RepID=UPI003757B07B